MSGDPLHQQTVPPSPSATTELAALDFDLPGCNGGCALLQDDVDYLKREVADIKHELLFLKSKYNQTATTDSCLLSVKLSLLTGMPLKQSEVENVLQCPVINYIIIRETPAAILKVKSINATCTLPCQSK